MALAPGKPSLTSLWQERFVHVCVVGVRSDVNAPSVTNNHDPVLEKVWETPQDANNMVTVVATLLLPMASLLIGVKGVTDGVGLVVNGAEARNIFERGSAKRNK